MHKFEFIFSFLIVVFLISSVSSLQTNSVSAKEDFDSLYDVCINNYSNSSQADNCKELLDKSRIVNELMSNIYLDQIDDYKYLACVRSEINSGNLNYIGIRDICYNNLIESNKLKKVLSLFNMNCFYQKKDQNGFYLDVTCKSTMPSICYDTDLELTKGNNSYIINPYIVKKFDSCLDLSKISVKKKTFSIDSIQSDIKMNTFKIVDNNNSEIEPKELFENSYTRTSNPLSSIEKAYYSCLVNYNLHYLFDYGGGIAISKTKTLTDSNLIDTCKDKITYAYSVYLDKTFSDRQMTKEKIQSKFKNFLIFSDVSDIDNFFDQVISDYNYYKSLNNKLESSSGQITYNFDLGVLFDRLSKSLNGRTQDQRQEIISGFNNTLIRDMDDKIQIRRIRDLESVIAFFKDQKANINDNNLNGLIDSIRDDIIFSLIQDKNGFDLSKVDFTITSGSITFDQVSIPLKQGFKISLDNNLNIVNNKDYLEFYKNGSIKISTSLPISYSDSNITVKNKVLSILNLDQNSLENKNVVKINLIEDQDGFLVYVVSEKVYGYFLGLFRVSQDVVKKYNAENGILFSSDLPWWNVLVLFKSSIPIPSFEKLSK